MSHYVYKYVKDDEIIYVGKNDTILENRLRQHGSPGDNISEEGWNDINGSEIYYVELANSIMSDVFESEMIRRYKPKYNIAKKGSAWSGLPFVEPCWKKFVFKEDNGTTFNVDKNKFVGIPDTNRIINSATHRFSQLWDVYVVIRLLLEYGELCLNDEKHLCINISDFFLYKEFPFFSNYDVFPKVIKTKIMSHTYRKNIVIFDSIWKRKNPERCRLDQVGIIDFPCTKFADSFAEAKEYYKNVLKEYENNMLSISAMIEKKYPYLLENNSTIYANKLFLYNKWADKPLPTISNDYWETNMQLFSNCIHRL